MQVYRSEWRRLWVGWSVILASLLFSLLSATLLSPTPSYAADNNATKNADGSVDFRGTKFTKTDIPCGANKDESAEKDIRNWAGDPNCDGSTIYYKNDAGSLSCDSYIAVKGNLNDPLGVQYLKREAQGITATCRVERSEELTLDGQSFGDKKRRLDEKNSRREAFEGNRSTICSRVEPDAPNPDACMSKLTAAFDACYAELGGKDGVERDVKKEDLYQCIANKTGYPLSLLQGTIEQDISNEEFQKCNVVGMGWIICEAANILSKLLDGMYEFLKEVMLLPSLDTNQAAGNTVYSSWRALNWIANIVFILGFLGVVYSQITGGGLSNYTIKRMMPRLIVAAILINSSFYICAIAIDISNILGTALKDVLVSIAPTVAPSFSTFGQVSSLALVGAGGAAISMMTFEILPIIVSGLVSLLITILILIARQAIIIVLVIVAPIAFALNILPNTQKWFNRWWTAFLTLLMLYPMVGIIYGGTRIAAGVISRSAPDDGAFAIIFAGLALGVMVIPFFITPILMKLSGNLLNRFTGIINNPDKGIFDKAKSSSRRWADNKYKEREISSLNGDGPKALTSFYQRRAAKTTKHKYQKGRGTNQAKARFLADEDVAASVADKATAGSTGAQKADRMKALEAMATQVRVQLTVEDVDAADAVIDELILSGNPVDISQRAQGKDENGNNISEEEQAAAIRRMAAEGNLGEIHSLIEQSDQMSQSLRKALTDGMAKNSVAKNAVHLSGSAINKIQSGAAGGADGVADLYNSAAAAGKYTPHNLSSQSADVVRGMVQHLDTAGKDAVRDSYEKMQNDHDIKHNLTSGANNILRHI
ncbi:hypothetical protein I8H83_05610 [Candidatus Saccharibacteria bacterium]|nr:hypothetical protein [Candidatus Saccharibacteria bacterium]